MTVVLARLTSPDWDSALLLDQDNACQTCVSPELYQNRTSGTCHTCQLCDAGFFLAANCTLTEDSVCEACPPNTFSLGAGETACIPVSPPCEPGTFQIPATSSEDRRCVPCPDGTFQDAPGSESCVPFSICQPGTRQIGVDDPVADRNCTACPVNFYQDEANTTSCKPTTICFDAQFEFVPQTTSSDRICANLTICPAGEETDVPATPTSDRSCALCNAGFYQPLADQPSCLPVTQCDSVEYESVAATTTSDRQCQLATVCGPGSFTSVSLGFNSDRSCSPCADRNFQLGNNSDACSPCTICSPGNFESPRCSNTSNSECLTCNTCTDGHYDGGGCDGVLDRNCIKCKTQDDCQTNEYISGECVPTANSGPRCLQCHPSCGSCNGPFIDNCTTCAPGLLLQESGECQSACRDNFYETQSGSCAQCHPSCGKTCSGPTASECTSCINPGDDRDVPEQERTFLQNGRCVEACSTGEYINQYTGDCRPCARCPPGNAFVKPCQEFSVCRFSFISNANHAIAWSVCTM